MAEINKINRISIVFSITIFFFNSCSNLNRCADVELKMSSFCLDTNISYSIPCSTLIDLPWTEFYIIGSDYFSEEITQIIGVEYKNELDEDGRAYIFLNNGQIVYDQVSYCTDFNLSWRSGIGGFVKLYPESIIRIKKWSTVPGAYFYGQQFD